VTFAAARQKSEDGELLARHFDAFAAALAS
jgi:hypothetical protein